MILQHSNRAVAQQNRKLPAGVYASWWSNGSPAHMYGLRATVWVTEVNGHPVPDLDTYVRTERMGKGVGKGKGEGEGKGQGVAKGEGVGLG